MKRNTGQKVAHPFASEHRLPEQLAHSVLTTPKPVRLRHLDVAQNQVGQWRAIDLAHDLFAIAGPTRLVAVITKVFLQYRAYRYVVVDNKYQRLARSHRWIEGATKNGDEKARGLQLFAADFDYCCKVPGLRCRDRRQRRELSEI